MPENQILLVYSGGLDSTVLLHHLLDQNYSVRAISFAYGQKHFKELEIAQKNCEKLGIPHEILQVPLDAYFSSTLLRGGGEIPEGHYESENMKQTVVPMRNLIFASIAAGYAASHKIPLIALGVHSGDHAIYPDCRPEFFDSVNATLSLADWDQIQVKTPFIHFTKDQIVARGIEVGVDFASTWTCYKGQETPCGKCGSCVERLEAFSRNGATDSLSY